MKYILGIEEQRKQLISVIEYLKSTGVKQKEIAFEIGVDNIYLSHLKNGTIIKIPPEVIEGLHDSYNVNPKYISHGASNMFDTAKLKYENFDEFVDSWDLVEHENKEYLHFTMDENFYNLLVSVFNLKEASSHYDDSNKSAEAFNSALESLKESYQPSSKPKEYVLIPADDMFEIANDNVRRRKSLNEVVNILNFYSEK